MSRVWVMWGKGEVFVFGVWVGRVEGFLCREGICRECYGKFV